MAETIYQTILLRRGPAATWVLANPILASGEPGVEADTLQWKIGDGVTAWASLPYESPYAYKRTMAGDEDIPYLSRVMICSMDPDGTDRIATPAAGFPAGSVIFITNRGANAITFDSAGLNISIGGGNKDFFTYDGINWG